MLKHFVKVTRTHHQCPFSVKKTRKIYNRVEYYWARTPTSSEQKCDWKNAGLEMVTGFVSFGTRQKNKRQTQYTGQIQRNMFYKNKSENMLLACGIKGKKLEAPALSDSWLNVRKISS